MTKMWKPYFVGVALFPCLIYVFCDTSSDDGPYRSPFVNELLEVLKNISNNLNVISENTDRIWTLQFNDEMKKMRTQNRKLRNNLNKLVNETAAEKKKSQEMDKLLMEKFKELQNLTSNLQKGSIAENNQIRINQEKVNKNVSNHLQNLDGKTDKNEIFTNNSYRDIKLDVDSLNASLIRRLLKIERKLYPRDCGDQIDSDLSLQNGVYKIYPHRLEEVSVYCDMNDGGWTVFQRRMNGNTAFYRGWNEYRDGFGDPADEYWLGNKYLHYLTRSRVCTLKVDLTNTLNIARYAIYTNFKIESEADNYRLRIGNYSGNAGRGSLSYHDNMEFTTKDRDHDTNSGGNCAVNWKGAWWYYNCHQSNLNGEYGRRDNKGVVWQGYPSSWYMKATTMKMKCK